MVSWSQHGQEGSVDLPICSGRFVVPSCRLCRRCTTIMSLMRVGLRALAEEVSCVYSFIDVCPSWSVRLLMGGCCRRCTTTAWTRSRPSSTRGHNRTASHSRMANTRVSLRVRIGWRCGRIRRAVMLRWSPRPPPPCSSRRLHGPAVRRCVWLPSCQCGHGVFRDFGLLFNSTHAFITCRSRVVRSLTCRANLSPPSLHDLCPQTG